MKYLMGIIQGRLSAPVDGRIQAFPSQTWKEEFNLAAKIGLDAIEWIFEDPIEENPIWNVLGRSEIKKQISDTGVKINEVCADYFMAHPFFRVSGQERLKSEEILKQLIPYSKDVGAGSVEIPFLDNSRIETEEEMAMVIQSIRKALPIAQENEIILSFEASLEPKKFVEFLSELNHPNVKVVYDIGNSASLGYNTREEISVLGKYLSNVHVKDRVLGGSTVPLGTGSADFQATFEALKNASYEGPITMQVARGEPGKESATTKSHLEFINKYL